MLQTILIIGGSRGIGEAMVRLYAASSRVVFTYRASDDKARKLAEETGATAFACDVRRDEDIFALRTAVPRLDTLIVNAGVASVGLFHETPMNEIDDLMRVNLRGAIMTARAFLPAMISARKGCILFVSSIWGLVGASCEAAYSASKAALIGLTKALAKEVSPSGVRVNCLCPGVINTDMLKDYDERDRRDLIERTPLGRLGTAEDVARAAAFLTGEDAAFITGQTLTVDGGFAL